MSATTPFGPTARPGDGVLSGTASSLAPGAAGVSAMGIAWSALHDAAVVVAALGNTVAAPMSAAVRTFPAVMRDAGGWRLELAQQGIDDLTAVMEPGLEALLAVHARGADPVPAARALWQEFERARDALLALVPPPA